MSETRIPGLKAKHAIVTPVCRENRGIGGAVEEALNRLHTEAIEIIRARDDDFDLHFVLTVERRAGAPEEGLNGD